MPGSEGNENAKKHGFYSEYLDKGWQKEYDKIFKYLKKQYKCKHGKNPQYLILVERATTAWIKLRQADEWTQSGGREINHQHYHEKERCLLKCLDQLMKYTESIKREIYVNQTFAISVIEIIREEVKDKNARERIASRIEQLNPQELCRISEN